MLGSNHSPVPRPGSRCCRIRKTDELQSLRCPQMTVVCTSLVLAQERLSLQGLLLALATTERRLNGKEVVKLRTRYSGD